MHIFDTLFERMWERKGPFWLAFFVVFMISYGALYAVDFVPQRPAPAQQAADTEITPAVVDKDESVQESAVEVSRVALPYPVRIVIDELGTDVRVLNPQENTIAALDAALLEGVVRHPDSANFSETGTMFLFGHSSYLPVVHNKNFQAFNGIQKLRWGDTVRVFSEDAEYVYRVTTVAKVAASDTSVSLDSEKNRLVLVTCNSFGSKDDRFMVEAELIEKRAL